MMQYKHATNAMQHVKHAKYARMDLCWNEKALAHPKVVAKNAQNGGANMQNKYANQRA